MEPNYITVSRVTGQNCSYLRKAYRHRDQPKDGHEFRKQAIDVGVMQYGYDFFLCDPARGLKAAPFHIGNEEDADLFIFEASPYVDWVPNPTPTIVIH